ncbi:unnamed protein product [Meganyctiphanes norvegica]|uniref:C-type lectin domain-containing protein n=1 Tax=Meganyctiphanes norvegica TaxID=48144 RepID=A0AAV2RBD0_MEGNR
MDWSWMCIVLFLLTSALPQDAAACDDDCKAAITQEFRIILKQELQPVNLILNELKPIYEFLNGKFKPLNDMQKEVGTIRRDTRDTFVISEQLLQHTQTIVTTQESISNNLHSVKANVESREYDTNLSKESNNGIKDLVISLENIVKEVKLTSNNTSKITMQIQQDIKDFETLLEPINDLNSFENKSNQILQDIEKGLVVFEKQLNATIPDNNMIIEQMEKYLEEMNKKITISDQVILNTLLMAGQDHHRCPEGFFVSTQCFTVLREQGTTWNEAGQRCRSQGLVLAEPTDTVVVPLRRFLLQIYGSVSFWINGQRDGGKFIWQRTNKTLVSNTGIWSSRQPAPGDLDSSGDCLSLWVLEEDWRNDTSLPYHPHDCSDIQLYPLCERILQKVMSPKDHLLMLEENMDKTEKYISLTLDTIENSISTILEAVETLQDRDLHDYPLLDLAANISTNQIEFERKVSTTIDKIENGISTIKDGFRSLRSLRCLDSEGLFSLSTQCFKLFQDKSRSWTDANSHCETHGLILAEPSDSAAVGMRNYLKENYGISGYDVWLGGKADGSKFVWQDSGRTLRSDNTLWHANKSPGSYIATKYCLMLLIGDYPGTPYYPNECSSPQFTLCEAK